MTLNPLAGEVLDAEDWHWPNQSATLPPPRFRLLTADQFDPWEKQEWAIKHLLPSMGLGAFFGASGTGKSFLIIEGIAKLAEAGSFFGHGVPKAHRVVVLVLEGEAGFRKRIKAWEIAKGRPFPKGVKFIFDTFNLLENDDLLALAEAVEIHGGCDVLVIDTLNAAAPGVDENSSRDASLILQSAKWLQASLGGLVLLVHHTGKDATKGMRGHSSIYAAMDAVIEVSRTAGRREWSVAKSKDDTDGKAHGFMLEVVDLGDDESGDPITSCVVRADDAPPDNRPPPPKGGNQKIIFTALCQMFQNSGVYGKPGAPATRPCLELERAIEETKGRLAVEPKRQAERARLAINNMVATGILGCKEGWLWLI
ncbi:AAA family ATPase [Hydrogenophaga sp.]|uniref:AAA family ATPase n=1 Tax=Hydrogenophaga sp. TaxID=1904254 RepID=UPI002ABA0252|nr:AAA family ATPase [Hydrogenophaga sp.]MDZ4397976.1 AAA family ATPase [Hydrogenophaga sp.]